jgi:hypothetical protein
MVVAAAGLGFGLAAISHAHDKDAPRPAPSATPVSEKAPEKVERKPVIEITRSTKPNCDVKPVMTDDEIAQCKKAWRK